MHACKQHTGSRKAAHETILDAIEAICRQAGITTERRTIPSVQKRRNKRGRGDLVLKNVNLGGHRHLVLEIMKRLLLGCPQDGRVREICFSATYDCSRAWLGTAFQGEGLKILKNFTL